MNDTFDQYIVFVFFIMVALNLFMRKSKWGYKAISWLYMTGIAILTAIGVYLFEFN